MNAIFYATGLVLQFSRSEDTAAQEILEAIAERYEEQGIDAGPIHHVIACIKEADRPVTVQ